MKSTHSIRSALVAATTTTATTTTTLTLTTLATLALLLAACPRAPADPEPQPEVDPPATACLDSGQGPSVENFDASETVHHNLVIVDGVAAGDTVVVVGADGARSWPVVAGRFRALVPLIDGDNCAALVDDGGTTAFHVTYTPDPNPRFIRSVYIDAVDGDGSFDAEVGEAHDEANAKQRLSTTMWLLQAFTAETMREEGFGRRTFRLQLETGDDGVARPAVETFASSLTLAEARALDGNALWSDFYDELADLPERDESKDVAVMAMTHYDAASGVAQAHTALGGDRLGLFGSGTLHTYAASLDDVVAAFNDDRDMDTAVLFDDSAFRDRHWANYATGIGAMLHELGHCLSLPHPSTGTSVMSRGFDHVNRKLVIEEPASATSPALSPVPTSSEVGWDRAHAVRLGFHPWLSQRDQPATSTLTLAIDGDTLTVDSASGVRAVQFHVDGNSVSADEHLTSIDTALSFSVADLHQRFPGALLVSAIDDDGNIAERDVP